MVHTKVKTQTLKALDSVCKYYKIPSIISFDRRGVPYVTHYQYQLCKTQRSYYHVDLYQIYKKPLVKSIIYQKFVNHKDFSLNTVCKVILDEGKYENLDGHNIQSLSKEEQLEYVTQDARLVMKVIEMG